MKSKNKSKKSQKKSRSNAVESRSLQRLTTGEDFGEATERELNSRTQAGRYGFASIPSSSVDTMSDLNVKEPGVKTTVEALSGDESANEAGDLSDLDTITDSNSLTSAAIISGAYHEGNPFNSRREKQRSDHSDAEDLGADSVRKVAPGGLGTTRKSDKQTTAGYIRANRKESKASETPTP